MKQFLLATATLIALSLLSAKLFAESRHQFSLNVSGTKLHYESEGEAKSYSLGGTAYFEPVKKSSALPYARSAFYSRTGGLSLSAYKEKQKDLNRIVAGRVLNSIEGKSYSANLFLAQENMPIWGQLNYTYLDKITYKYSGGPPLESDSDSVRGITLGTYIGKTLSIHGSYSKQDDTTYGIGLRKLFHMDSLGFLETNLNFSITDKDRTELTIRNNIVRNVGTRAYRVENGLVSLTYFPIPQTGLTIYYQHIDYDRDDKDQYYSINLEHYFFNQIKLGLGHTLKDATNFDNIGDYRATTLALGFDF